jgi:hypothetical protein
VPDDSLIDNVRRLARGWQEQQVTPDGVRTIHHPPLLRELRQAATWTKYDDDENSGSQSRGTFRSRPPMRAEPWLLMLDVEDIVADIAARLGLPRRRDPCEQLGAILASLASAETSTQSSIALEVWNLRVRVETSLRYRQPPRTLEAPCPLCGERHQVKVYLGEFGPERAGCDACHTQWGYESLGILAEMLMSEAGSP